MTPLAALLGGLHSLAQAGYTVGLCLGGLAAFSAAERWLTRQGPISRRGIRALAGAGFMLTLGLTVVVFALQLESDFAAKVWRGDPAAACEALLSSAAQGRTLGVFVLVSLASLPAGLALYVYLGLDSTRPFETVDPTAVGALPLAVCGGVCVGLIDLFESGRTLQLKDTFELSLGATLAIFFCLYLGASAVLLAFHVGERVERAVWRGRPVRWPTSAGPQVRGAAPCGQTQEVT